MPGDIKSIKITKHQYSVEQQTTFLRIPKNEKKAYPVVGSSSFFFPSESMSKTLSKMKILKTFSQI
jgi:hypothetical protein